MTKIGLEIHVQLRTNTKLFCGCPNRFEEKPNTLTCEYCIGSPGSKPVLNEKTIEAAIKIGLALNCKFPKEMIFSRKNYFYPDMGKNFQITQYEYSIAKEGYMESNGKKIGITRVQMEEDPARIVHMKDYILVDYNRSGVPLCEIVTDPDFTEPKEARIFLQQLASILEYLGVMDPAMEGSMRVDANISMGSNRVEVKNITGFKEVEKAFNYEMIRQKQLISTGQDVKMETRGWDSVSNVTKSLRSKEKEEEYGYITEPDLPRISLDKKKIDSVRKSLPEMAHDKIKRYKKEMKIDESLSKSITSEIDLAQTFEKVAKKIDSNFAAKWFAGYIKKTLNFNSVRLKDTQISTEDIITVLEAVRKKEITERAGEMIFRKIVELEDVNEISKTIRKMTAENVTTGGDEVDKAIDDVIKENKQAVDDYKSGKKESFNFLVGQVMRKTKGRSDPETVRKLLDKKL